MTITAMPTTLMAWPSASVFNPISMGSGPRVGPPIAIQ